MLSAIPSDVRLQFRNFPLAFHPQAALAHEAAMTAARDGRFWEFAAFVLDHQDSLREQDLIAYAGRLGLDAAEVRRDAPGASLRAARRGRRQAGQQRGIRGSPAIVINDKRIDGVPSAADADGVRRSGAGGETRRSRAVGASKVRHRARS